MSAALVLHEFIEHWGEAVKIESICEPVFFAKIKYKSALGVIIDETKVYLVRNGYEAGKVCLAETRKLTSSRLHLDFFPDFQAYSLTRRKRLKVSGKSEKMRGKYTVFIRPIRALHRSEFP